MNIYEMCKKLIINNKYDKEDILGKLDIFLLSDRVSKEQYLELIGMME